MECELLGTCGFFKKYGELHDVACRGFINKYCKGEKMNECQRKIFREKNGAPPPDDMMPNGQMMVQGRI
ncbi:MAG: hypothetical protein JW803_03885 [Endomicrobiales bacterium]|nr:hypothetical protein [Endomicrobiales bacterium]